jgi:hypothetical protein
MRARARARRAPADEASPSMRVPPERLLYFVNLHVIYRENGRVAWVLENLPCE